MQSLGSNCCQSVIESKPLCEKISDAGAYSYTALTSLVLHELFYSEYDREFCCDVIKRLIPHNGLPAQVENGLMELFRSDLDKQTVFMDVLLKEPVLKNGCLPLLQDLVLFGVKGGMPTIINISSYSLNTLFSFSSVKGIASGVYDARMRVLVRHMALLLKINYDLIDLYEESVVEYLSAEVHEQSKEEEKEQQKRQKKKKIKRYALISIATLSGGALLGLTGGLAAPLIGAGVGTIIGGTSAAVLGSTAGIAVVGSLFGVAGAGLSGYKMQKRVGEVEEFAFEYLTKGSQLHITIAICGWLTDVRKDCFQRPWRSLANSREQYCLKYESKFLYELGQAMEYLLTFAVSIAAQEALKFTILSGLITAITWPTSLLTLASVIDNPWGVCCRRSAEVGKQLAEILLSRQQGRRPVTLIGFSLGARVIFYCLQEMSKRNNCEGIIQDAILLGAPITGNTKSWKQLSRVVSGRIVNGYCRSDWLLKFLYRTSSIAKEIAGLQPINWDDRRMHNFDLSAIVEGHMDYYKKLDEILPAINIHTTDDNLDVSHLMRKSMSDSGSYHSRPKADLLSSKVRRSKSDSYLLFLEKEAKHEYLYRSLSSDCISLDASNSTKFQKRNSSGAKDLTKISVANLFNSKPTTKNVPKRGTFDASSPSSRSTTPPPPLQPGTSNPRPS